uniref:Uncharacterized protein n=1 Tax=viral metagenome TaxID=1070528 RepID=A0A6M3JMR2_9ZZZZ
MCGYTDGEGSGGSLQKMIDVIKNGVKDKNEYGEWIFIDLKREAAILTELKNMTTCPACILAALRQSGFPYLFPSFDFKKEKDAMFKEHNADVNQSYAY